MRNQVPAKLMKQLEQQLPALKRLFAAERRVVAVWLFGSLVDGYATARSDMDFAVLLDHELDYTEEADLELKVRQALGLSNVDFVYLNCASLLLRFRAISGTLLYERNDVRVSDFIERTIKQYQEFQLYWPQFDRDYAEGIKHDYGRIRRKARADSVANHRKQSARS